MVTLREAQPTDAGATGAILSAFQETTGWMPKLYSVAETIGFCGEMIDRGWVTVAMSGERAVGFIARDDDEICALYVSDHARGQGVGRCLVDDARMQSDRLRLKVFQANTDAQKFYVRIGFDEVARGDGAQNEENLPDISFVWQREKDK